MNSTKEILPGILGDSPKLGILGGGQLGKMLAHAAANWDLPLYILDKHPSFPAAPYAACFVEGDFNNYDDVLAFGRMVDIITIEIEHVNLEALLQLQAEGKIIHPNPESLQIIKDKGIQKEFYRSNDFPTSPFQLYDDASHIKSAISNGELSLPFVQKSRGAGYDGKGVAIIKEEKDLGKILDTASMVEPLVDIAKEIAVVASRNMDGQIVCFDPVEMEFNAEANLVEFLFAPADISTDHSAEAVHIASDLIEKLDICGLLAVEFFITKSGELLINEVAPRPHNSGHHSIDACNTSQFEQHLRGVLNLPLGSTSLLAPSVMINLLGEKGHTGKTVYQGLSGIMSLEGVHLHIYGKKETRPMRKMGHLTVVNPDLEKAIALAREAQSIFKIVS